MRKTALFSSLLWLSTGCLSITKPMTVLVQDAETKKPIPSVEVKVCYPTTLGNYPVHEDKGTTGDKGIVQVHAATNGYIALVVEGSKEGYVTEDLAVQAEAVRSLPGSPLFSSNKKSSPNFTLNLYSGPRPNVDLIVPKDFKGVIQADCKFEDDFTYNAGQRTFTYHVPPSGLVELFGPKKLLHGLSPKDYQAHYPDGTPIVKPTDAKTVGFRWVKTVATVDYFHIGTQEEFNQVRGSSRIRSDGDDKSDPKSTGRGGRRRH